MPRPPDPRREIDEHRISEVMRAAQVDAALVYAFQKCDFVVTEANHAGWSKADLKKWNAAIAEYHRRVAGGETDPVP